MACRPIALISVGVFLLIFGILLALLGPLVVPPQLDTAFSKGVDEYVVVDSTDAQGYGPWSGDADKTSPFYYIAHMWNLTNADDVRQANATPVYKSVGPYYYRRYKHAENVSFPDGGNMIRYSMPENIVFERDMSVGDDSELITNVNPAYVAILTQFYAKSGLPGQETYMIVGAGQGFLQMAIDWYQRVASESFWSLYTGYRLNEFLEPRYKAKVSATNATYFMAQWANATNATGLEGGDWTGLLVSQGGIASNISEVSAQRLFGQTNCGLLDSNANCSLLWYKARFDAPSRSALQNTFELTDTSLDVVLTWMNSTFSPAVMEKSILSEFGAADVTELGWRQFYNGTVLGKTIQSNESACVAVFSVWPNEDRNIYAPIEMACDAINNGQGFPNIHNASRAYFLLTDSSRGFGNSSFFQFFMGNADDLTTIGMTQAESDFLYAYMMDFYAQSTAMTIRINGPSGGLVPARSVRSWLWDCNDLLLSILQPGPSCSLLQNNTYFPPNTIYSGKNNITQANVFVNWRSDNNTIYGWAQPFNVSGGQYTDLHTDMGQFQPGIQVGEPLWVFDDDLIRPLRLNYLTNNDTIKDIPVFTYKLDFNIALGNNSLYNSPVVGLTNMSAQEFGSPAFLSLWDMYGVDPAISSGVIGMNNSLDEMSATTILKIEPITGNTIYGAQRIQVNVYIPDAGPPMFDQTFGNANMRLNTYFPLAKIEEYALIGDGDADMLKSKLSLVPTLKKVVFFVSVIAGPLTFLAGISVLVLGIRRRRDGYEVIND